VGLAGLEPAASSLSGIEGSALCGPPFSQVAHDRKGRRDAFLATSVSAGQGRRDERQRQADGRPAKQYEQGDHADRSKGHYGLIGSFLRIWHLASGQCRSRGGGTRIRPRALLLPTPRTGRRWHRDRRKYPLTYQDLAAESLTSAVTVKVTKRSPSGPDTAGASGPGLAPRLGPLANPVRPGGRSRGATAAGGFGSPRPR
jgi:hypothetical protein